MIPSTYKPKSTYKSVTIKDVILVIVVMFSG